MPLEIQLLHRVQQVPGVVKMYDFFELADFFVIIMEKPESVTVCLDRTRVLELNPFRVLYFLISRTSSTTSPRRSS